MSRSKKSRKPGRLNPVKADKKAIVEEKPSRVRKTSGNKAGTRQTIAFQKEEVAVDDKDRDPRIGSKTPIDLGVKSAPVKAVSKKVKDTRPAVAPITVIDDSELWEQELLAIESNEQLQSIASRSDDGEPVTEEEAELLASSLARYQQLITKLGLEDDEEETDEDDDDLSEDDLLNKLDGNDFSEFET